MSRKAVWIAAALVVLALVALFVFNQSSKQPEAPAQTKVTVAQWGQEKYLIYLPLYVGMERGFFRDAGLEVNLIFSGNDDQTFAAVAQGGAMFGVGDPIFAAIANQKGLGARVVALLVGEVAIWGVTNRPELKEISKPTDLAGLRIGTFPAPSTNYTLVSELVRDFPSAFSRPAIVQAPIGAQLALLENKSADIAMVLEPAASIAESQGYRVVYSSPKFHGAFAFTGVTVTKETVEASPEVVRRFVGALERSLRTCHEHPEVAIDVAKSLFPQLSEKVVESAINRMLRERTIPLTPVVDKEAWKKALETRIRVGDLPSLLGTEEAVDNQFALSAAK